MIYYKFNLVLFGSCLSRARRTSRCRPNAIAADERGVSDRRQPNRRRISMSRVFRDYLYAGGLTLLVLLLVSGGLSAGSFVEDFATLDYCDTSNTTAWWDTLAGEVKLPPFELTLAGTCLTAGGAQDVSVIGNYAYVTDGTGLHVVDISDPANPGVMGSCLGSGYAYSSAISGCYAFVAASTAGLQVVDISDPTNPTLAASYVTPGSAYDVAISGDYAYVADYTSGIYVIDISDPTLPAPAGSLGTSGAALGVAISGDYAFIADHATGLAVIDISDPTSPTPRQSTGRLR
jgi:hypothetical protein